MMLSRAIKFAGVPWLAALLGFVPVTVTDQFGVGGNGDRPEGGRTATLEELNKLAAEFNKAADGRTKASERGSTMPPEQEETKNRSGGEEIFDLESIIQESDPYELFHSTLEGLKDRDFQEAFPEIDAQGAIEVIRKMDPVEFKRGFLEAASMMTITHTCLDKQENIFEQKDEVFPKMEDQEMTSVLQDTLAGDEKIEEARLLLLSDPTFAVAGNEAFSDMFGSEEMKEILMDPVEWRKNVKDGRRILAGGGSDESGGKGGIGIGEL